MRSTRRINFSLFAAASFTLSAYVALYFLRRHDDDRLTSWDWAFQGGAGMRLFLILAAGTVASLFFANRRLPKKSRGGVIFLFAFFAAVPFWSEPEVIVDASRYFTEAKHLELFGAGYFIREWGREISAWTDMPLVPFLYGIIFRAFGESRVYIQAFNAALFGMSAVLTFLIGDRLWDEEIGFFAGMLLPGIPYLLTQTPLMLVDLPTMFFLLLAIWTFISALRRGGVWTFFAAAAVFCSFYSKYSAWLMLSVLIVIFLVLASRKTGEPGLRTLFVRMSTISLLSAIFIGAFFLYKGDVFTSQIRLLLAYQKPGLSRWGESFFSTFFFQTAPLITVAAAYSLYAAAKRKDPQYLIVLWLVLVVFGLGIRRIRYIIMVFPMVALMASYGISALHSAALKKYIVACALAFSLTVGIFAFLPFLKGLSAENLRNAGRFLDSLPERGAVVFTTMPEDPAANPAIAVPLLDIYTKKRIFYNYDLDLSVIPRKEIEESALRFTWEYRNPVYYRIPGKPDRDTAAVLILNKASDPIPENLRVRLKDCMPSAVFENSEDLFRVRTAVRVYRCG